jgi:hypothetical protein
VWNAPNDMSTLIPCSFAAAVLVSAGSALAQSGEPDQFPPRSVTFGIVTPAQAQFEAQADAPAAATSDESTPSENRLRGGDFFVPLDGSRPPPLQPPQRAAVRASLEQRYPDLAEGLGIDALSADKLLDLLAEHQLSAFERTRLDPQDASSDWVLKEADAESKRLDALRALLGEAAMERYLDYSSTVGERWQVATFDKRLPPEHKLRPAQKQQMIALYQEASARESELQEQRRPAPIQRFFPGEDLQRASRLATIAANEEHLHTMAHSHRWLSERAAQFLTAPQLAHLAQLHSEQRGSLKQWIERARVDAGLEPTIPDRELEAPGIARDVAREGQLTVDIELTINRDEPLMISRVMTSGETVTIEAGNGLFVQAKPQLYEDRPPIVRLDYYEQHGARRRRLANIATVSNMPTQTPQSGAERIGIETFIVATGHKAYAIRANVSVAAL